MIIGLSQIYKSTHMDNLRKLVLGVSIDSLFDLIKEEYDTPLIENLRQTKHTYPEIDFTDAFSRGQVASKQWLINELSVIENQLGQVFIMAGWYGTLAALMFESQIFQNLNIKSFDIDSSCAPAANSINQTPWVDNGHFNALTADIYELDMNPADTIINTSCEHLAEFDKWFNLIPNGKLVVLQSNNFYSESTHCNCVNSVEELIEMAPLTELMFSETLEPPMYTPKYNRFMIIGRK